MLLRFKHFLTLSCLLLPLASFAWPGGIGVCPENIDGATFHTVQVPHVKEDTVFVYGDLDVDGYKWHTIAEIHTTIHSVDSFIRYAKQQSSLAVPYYTKPKYLNGVYECRYHSPEGIFYYLQSK